MSKKKIIIVVVAIVVVAAIAGIYVVVGHNKTAGLYLQGEELYNSDHYAEAVECFKPAAESGEDGAQYYLGKCYFEGTGVEKNYQEAAKWLQESAEQDNYDAMIILGECYLKGLGVTKNVEEAAKWFEKRAELYMPDGMIELALAYAYGQGVEKSKEMAIKTIDTAINKSTDYKEEMLDAKGEILYVFGDKEGAKQLFIEVLTNGSEHWYDHNETKLRGFMFDDEVWFYDDNAFVELINQ